jgi:hypothetical protein
MEQDRKIDVEQIMGQLECPKDFQCCMSGLEDLCQATDIGSELFLGCLEADSEGCKFSFAFFGYGHLCECPLRVYITKKLKK